MALESSQGELQLWFRPRSNRMLQSGDMSPQSSRDSNPGQFWDSREKEPFGCSLGGELQRILYGGRWWLPLSLGRGESSVSKCPWLVATPKGVLECELTLLWLVLDANSSEIILVPLPSLSWDFQHAPLPTFSAGSRERPSSPNFPQFNIFRPSSGSNKGLRSASHCAKVNMSHSCKQHIYCLMT